MRAHRIVTALAGVALVLGLYVGARSVGSAPPLGSFLDPANGVWTAAGAAELPSNATLTIAGLSGNVRVLYDRRGVPHIFAETEEDAYRALGFVVARDRLFQLDLQTLAAAGRLTEVAGARAIPLDRATRALGLPRSAPTKLAALDTTLPGSRAVLAYSDGINAWLDAMRPADLPIEHRLLGRRPARWEPLNTMHLLNRMAYTLALQRSELLRHAAAQRVGREAAEALFPLDNPIQEPIQPTGATMPRVAHRPLPPPPAQVDTVPAGVGLSGDPFDALLAVARGRDEMVGSNNWAVAPRRTRDGHALLAGDPHLELTLPSIWYEAHLVVPGRLDVYGVTIPGLPFILIGFNRDVAWSFTNTSSDVLDYYAETVDDTLRPTRYRLDGAWRPLELREEVYLDRAGRIVERDTMYYTHRGPLTRRLGGWHSMRWTALEASSEAENFARVARATTVDAFLEAMATFRVPAQNMIVADRRGSIAIRSTGTYPIRPGVRGDTIFDGSTTASDWVGELPVSAYPFSKDPARGFLSSANQQPIDPATSGVYLGFDWYAPWRAIRINELLRADSAVTVEAMARYQLDPRSPRAETFVPAFLDAAERERVAGRASETLIKAARHLAAWDRSYVPDDRHVVLFERAMEALADRLWDELESPADADGQSPKRLATPGGSIVAGLLLEPESAWWDVRSTPDRVETRDDVLAASLERAFATLEQSQGPAGGEGWRWDRSLGVNIFHLLRLPSFSRTGLGLQGGPGLLNPASFGGVHGASWRMVVELGPEIRAFGIYPGGQSGNPISSRYDDRMAAWLTGRLDTLQVPARAEALAPTAIRSTLVLEPRR